MLGRQRRSRHISRVRTWPKERTNAAVGVDVSRQSARSRDRKVRMASVQTACRSIEVDLKCRQSDAMASLIQPLDQAMSASRILEPREGCRLHHGTAQKRCRTHKV